MDGIIPNGVIAKRQRASLIKMEAEPTIMMHVVPFEQAKIASIDAVSAWWRGTCGCARRNRITPAVIVDVVIDNLGWAYAPVQDAGENTTFHFIVDKPYICSIAYVDDVTSG